MKEYDWPEIISDWGQIQFEWGQIISGWDEIVPEFWGSVEGSTKIHTLKAKKEKENSTFNSGSE